MGYEEAPHNALAIVRSEGAFVKTHKISSPRGLRLFPIGGEVGLLLKHRDITYRRSMSAKA